MMASVREYILSVVAAAILCGILRDLAGEKEGTGAVVTLLSGLLLALAMIRPIAAIQLEELTLFTSDLEAQAIVAAAQGQESYEDSVSAIIKADCEAYILDKARSLEVSITAEVLVNGDSIPEAVTLWGSVSPYAKQKLENAIAEDLGIPKERQVWIG